MNPRRNNTKSALLAAMAISVTGLGACSHDDSPDTQPALPKIYSVTLTNIDIVKKGGSVALGIDGLPVNGATVTVD